jgi:hypothetical protein
VSRAFALLLVLVAVGAGQDSATHSLKHRVVTIRKEVSAGFGGGLQLTSEPPGNVTIVGSKRQAVEVEATCDLYAPSEEDLDRLGEVVGFTALPDFTNIIVESSGPHDKNYMKAFKDFPKRLRKMPFQVHYNITVPSYTGLDLTVADGAVMIEGVNGLVNVRCVRGPVTLRNVTGSVELECWDGAIDIYSDQRTWPGGGLTATTRRGGITMHVPRDYAARLVARAAGGVFIEDGELLSLGPEVERRLGPGGSSLVLTAVGPIRIVMPATGGEDKSEQQGAGPPRFRY